VNVAVGDVQALESLIAAHQGENVVFVDYWATWCEPCVEYFPHTVELSRKYQDRGLATIAVSFDDPAAETTVRDFLSKHGADFQNLISSYDLGPAAFEAFGIDQVPHFRLYDRQGRLRHQWDEKPKDVDQKIEELLADQAPRTEDPMNQNP
jgi:thiol-disulfide isomerase/thioredoxin